MLINPYYKMKKKISPIFLIFFIISLLLVSNSYGQNNIQSFKNWKIYDIHNSGKIFNYISVDSLKYFKSLKLEDDTIKLFLKNSFIWVKDKTAMWMGAFHCTAENEKGEITKINVSFYGSFLKEINNEKYYEINDSLKESWNSYFNEKLHHLLEPDTPLITLHNKLDYP